METKINHKPGYQPLPGGTRATGAIKTQMSEISSELTKIRFHTANSQVQLDCINDALRRLAHKIEQEHNQYWLDMVIYPHICNLRHTVGHVVEQYEASEALPILTELVAYSARSFDTLKTNIFDQIPEQRESAYTYRQHALEAIGPLLTPAQVANRLGVTVVSVNNWRKQDKLLGVRFDNHQFLYPAWQFVESPEQGEHGILRHLDTILVLMGDAHPWVKARFFLKVLPKLGGKTVLQVLQAGDAQELEFVKGIAEHRDELGSGT